MKKHRLENRNGRIHQLKWLCKHFLLEEIANDINKTKLLAGIVIHFSVFNDRKVNLFSQQKTTTSEHGCKRAQNEGNIILQVKRNVD